MTIDMFGAQRGADFSPDRRWRYRLWDIWDAQRPLACWCMFNSSDADENDLDPTVTRVRNFSTRMEFGGFYVVNLYAFVSSKPAVMDLAAKQGVDIVGPHNDTKIRETVAQCAIVVVAWGSLGGQRKERVEQVRALLPKSLLCLRKTKDGHPEHPLYIPGEKGLEKWP